MRLRALVLFAASVTAITVATVEGQGKKKPPTSRPGTAVFRCAVSDAADCPGIALSIVPDGIRSDGLGAYAPPPGGEPSGPGVFLDSVGEFSLHYSGEGRAVWLDFRNQIAAPSCGTACKKHFETLTLQSFWIHTNVVDATGNEVNGGLTTIPVGGSSKARLKVVFDTIDRRDRRLRGLFASIQKASRDQIT